MRSKPRADVSTATSSRRPSPDFLPELNPKEIELVVLAARDKNGQICRVKVSGREQVLVGNQMLLDSDDPRIHAELTGAIEILLSLGVLDVVGKSGITI